MSVGIGSFGVDLACHWGLVVSVWIWHVIGDWECQCGSGMSVGIGSVGVMSVCMFCSMLCVLHDV